jgi:hypothetical protein
MARIEKTVFISYRRKDIAWALAVYQYLSNQKYDVFFDYTSIPSGDFEQIIVSNIKARAHFVVILTPTSLDRCSNPGDWLRREIETAIDEKRNIIPLFFDGFNFGSPSVAEKITGKLSIISHYNGLEIPSGYFIEAMERLSFRYLNVPLNAVLHPIPTEVQKVVKEEQVAADEALKQREDVKELIKPIEEKPREEQGIYERKDIDARAIGNISAKTPNRKTAIRLLIYIVMLSVVCLVVGFYGRTLVDMLTNVSLSRCSEFLLHLNWFGLSLKGKETKPHGSLQANIPCFCLSAGDCTRQQECTPSQTRPSVALVA